MSEKLVVDVILVQPSDMDAIMEGVVNGNIQAMERYFLVVSAVDLVFSGQSWYIICKNPRRFSEKYPPHTFVFIVDNLRDLTKSWPSVGLAICCSCCIKYDASELRGQITRLIGGKPLASNVGRA